MRPGLRTITTNRVLMLRGESPTLRMLLRVSWQLTVAGCAAGGSPKSADHSPGEVTVSPGGIDRPLTRERLLTGRFVAYSAYWSVRVPGGDPIRFLPDGRVENRRAGLAGSWQLLSDTSVQIGGFTFYHRPLEQDLFDRPSSASAGLPPGTFLNGTRIVAAPDPQPERNR